MENKYTVLKPEGEVRVHTAIADVLYSAGKLWYAAKATELQGCGKVYLSWKTLFVILGVTTKRSVLTMLSEGTNPKDGKVKLFYSYSTDKEGVTLRHRGINEVAKDLGLSDLGVCFKLPLYELGRIKIKATEALAKYKLKTSYLNATSRRAGEYNDKWSRNERLRKQTITVQEIFNQARISDQISRRISYAEVKGKTVILIDSDSKSQYYGNSQEQLGKFIGRSKSTINRRLKETNKVQQYREVSKLSEEFAVLKDNLSKGNFKEAARYGFFNDKCYKACTNLYDIDIKLTKASSLRKRFKQFLNKDKAVESIKTSNSTSFTPVKTSYFTVNGISEDIFYYFAHPNFDKAFHLNDEAHISFNDDNLTIIKVSKDLSIKYLTSEEKLDVWLCQ